MDIAALRGMVGDEGVVTDPEVLAGHVTDWTGRHRGHSEVLVAPADTAQLAAVIGWCRRQRIAVVPHGGNTGLVAGATPMGGELVLSTRRLVSELDVDADAGVVRASAGCTLAQVQQAAALAGWRYGVDLGARDSATIGGTIATNAGGLQVLRHGDTRAQLLGVEAVDGTGTVVGDLRGLVKDNTGYHLPSLLAGSEGTLAVISRACLRLVPAPAEVAVALVGFASAESAIAAVGPLRRTLPDLSSLEFFLADGLELVCDTFDLAPPFARSHAAYLLVEVSGDVGVVDRLSTGALPVLVGADEDVAVAQDSRQRAALWRYREAHTEALAVAGVPHKLDVTLPLHRLAEFVRQVPATASAAVAGSQTVLFGHAGDGNLHVNVLGAATDDPVVDDAILSLVVSMGGSISAEHGIGRAKAAWLGLNRTPQERALFARIKQAFDPDAILNPGVIFAVD